MLIFGSLSEEMSAIMLGKAEQQEHEASVTLCPPSVRKQRVLSGSHHVRSSLLFSPSSQTWGEHLHLALAFPPQLTLSEKSSHTGLEICPLRDSKCRQVDS